MNNKITPDAKPNGGCGNWLVAGLAGLTILALLLGLFSQLSNDASQRAAEHTQQVTIAQQAQTERARIEADARREQAQLRAEQDARMTNYAGLLALVFGGCVGLLLLGGGLLFGLNWIDQRQLQRTLILIEAQRQAALPLSPPTTPTFARRSLAGRLPQRSDTAREVMP
jgi:hypothetical protein